MAGLLRMSEAVVTGDLLGRQHQGETALAVVAGVVITPTGWDYIRQHRLELIQDGDEKACQAAEASPQAADGETSGRCDHPEKSCGCQKDEFGSGFVEPDSCFDCPIHALKREGKEGCSCEGCNRHKAMESLVNAGKGVDIETLIQQVTDQIMARADHS